MASILGYFFCVPQGGCISPILFNIYLDKLDKELESRGLRFVRYADDFDIFVKSEMAANRVMASVSSWLERKLRLKVSATKTKVVRPMKRIIKSNLDDTSIYQAAMTRLGWYRQCGLSVFNFLLSPKVLAMPKENRTDKRKSRPGLVDPYALYQNLRTPICM